MQTTQGVVNPLGLDIIDSSSYPTLHEVRDPEHRDALARDMRARGWQGAPLVVMSDYSLSLTGVHRRAAAELAELDFVPGVELEHIFESCDLDLWEIVNSDEGYQLDAQYYDFARIIADHLTAEVTDAYGLDLH